MRRRIQPVTYTEGYWRIEGHSGFAKVPGETAAMALMRAVDYVREAIGETVLQVIKLDNPSRPEFPHFALFCESRH